MLQKKADDLDSSGFSQFSSTSRERDWKNEEPKIDVLKSAMSAVNVGTTRANKQNPNE